MPKTSGGGFIEVNDSAKHASSERDSITVHFLLAPTKTTTTTTTTTVMLIGTLELSSFGSKEFALYKLFQGWV